MTHGCVLMLHVFMCVSSRLSLSVERRVPGEPSDQLSGAAHPVPSRIQLGASS